MESDDYEARTGRVLESLSEPTRSNLQKHLEAPLLSTSEISERIRSYEVTLEHLVSMNDRLDQWTANIVGRKCLALLARFDEVGSAEQRLIQAAALYFVEEDDGEGDITSALGFDDDLEVVDAVAKELGYIDVVNMHGA